MKNIGTVTIEYTEEGEVRTVGFKPDVMQKEDINKTILKQISKAVDNHSDADTIKHFADLVLADFFAQMNEIELADRDKFFINSTIEQCVKYDNGNVKICSLHYSLDEVSSNTKRD